jgi:hypothetical protein
LQEASEEDAPEDRVQEPLVTGHAPLLAEANLISVRFRLNQELHVAAAVAAGIVSLVPYQVRYNAEDR